MMSDGRADLILASAKTLIVNGQSTEQTVATSSRLAARLGLHATILVGWGELILQADDGRRTAVRIVGADPTGVDMDRVASTMRVIDEVIDDRLAPEVARRKIETISKAPPVPTWLFTIAAAAGAAALSVIFGVHHLTAASLIAVSAAAGALLRRGVAHFTGNAFLQPFCAALLAGVVGALAVRYQLSSSLRLVAVCPCMILVPGPHILNGGLDLIRGRVHLGASRVVFAGLVIVAISTGLLLGMALFGIALPVDPAGRVVPLWQDVVAAGVAVAAYSIFFSMPLRMLAWPVAIGTLAHALRWCVMTGLGVGPASGALIACITAGLVLTPVANRWRMPFAAVGFAAVVSMMPGVFLFRMASGLAQIAKDPAGAPALAGGAFSDAVTAIAIVLAMSLGLLAPKLVIDSLSARVPARRPGTGRTP